MTRTKTRANANMPNNFVSVLDYGAVGDGVTDDTAAIQAAINDTYSKALLFPAGDYLVTQPLEFTAFNQLIGETEAPSLLAYGKRPPSVKIKYRGTGDCLTLVEPPELTGSYKWGVNIKGIFFEGPNNVSGQDPNRNARYGLNLTGILGGNIENCGITDFEIGMHIRTSIKTNYYNLQIFYCNDIGVQYSGVPTTDVWESCWFSDLPMGVEVDCAAVNSRFNDCIWENIRNTGILLGPLSFDTVITNMYSENVPDGRYEGDANDDDKSVIQIGRTLEPGETPSAAPTLIGSNIILGGSNQNNPIGSGVHLYSSYRNILSNVVASRFPVAFKVSADAVKNSLSINGCSHYGNALFTNDSIEAINGTYDAGDVAQTTGTLVVANRVDTRTIGPGGSLSIDASIISMTNGTATAGSSYVAPNIADDNKVFFGISAQRWSTIYSGTPSINTSDVTTKQSITPPSDSERKAALEIKALVKRYKFNDAVKQKGPDKARWHFGVMAQDIQKVFENNGLDPHEYGLFCEDVINEETGETRLGVRYTELFAFILAAL